MKKYIGQHIFDYVASFRQKVGIGTDTPAQPLHVSGNARVDGDFFIIESNPQIFLADTNHNSDFSINLNSGLFKITDTTNTVDVLTIDSSSNVGIGLTNPTEKLHVSGNAIITGDLTVSGTTTTIDTTNLNVEDKNITINYSTGDSSSTADGAGITIQDAVDSSNDATILWDATNDEFDFSHGATFSGAVNFGVDDTGVDVKFYGATSGRFMLWDESLDSLIFKDNVEIRIGSGFDLRLSHDGSHSRIKNNNGDLFITQKADDGDISFQSDDGSGGTTEYFRLDGGDVKTIVNQTMEFQDNVKLAIGNSEDLTIDHNATNSRIFNNTGNLRIINSADNGDITFESDDGSGGVTTYLTLDGGFSSPQIIMPDNVQMSFGTGLDLRIIHDGFDSYITSNGTGDLYIRQANDDKDIIFQSDDGSGGLATYITIDGSTNRVNFNKPIKVADNTAVNIGSGLDLQLSHDGSDSYISQNGAGHLYIENNNDDQDVIFRCDDGSGGTTNYFKLDGGDAIIKFEKDTKHFDNVKGTFGNASDLQIYHSGTKSFIQNETGHLDIRNTATNSDIIFQADDGSGSFTTYFQIDGGDEKIYAFKDVKFGDGISASFGNNDLLIQHNGTKSFINNFTGDLEISNSADDSDIKFICDDGSGGTQTYLTIDGGLEAVIAPDTIYLAAGNSLDLSLRHDGTNSHFQNNTGNLTIKNAANDKDIIFQCDDGSGGLTTYFKLDGSIATHDGSSTTSMFTKWEDNSIISLGTSNDARLYHNGTDTYLDNLTGDYYIRQKANDKDLILQCDDGSGGNATYITLDGSDVNTTIHTIKVLMPNLPTSDPSNAGQLWNDSGTLKISAG